MEILNWILPSFIGLIIYMLNFRIREGHWGIGREDGLPWYGVIITLLVWLTLSWFSLFVAIHSLFTWRSVIKGGRV